MTRQARAHQGLLSATTIRNLQNLLVRVEASLKHNIQSVRNTEDPARQFFLAQSQIFLDPCVMETQSLLPDSTERALIRTLLRSHSTPPAHLTSKISALSDELAEADQNILKDYYEDVRSLFAPIRRLPSEILTQIFEESEGPVQDPDAVGPVLDSNPLESDMARLARQPLLTLSQVCTRWHEIVLGTPSFWDTIELYSMNFWCTERHFKRGLALLKLALDRGRNTPLTFGISIVDGMDCAGALKLLAQHCERWKTAHFYCCSSDLRHLRSIKGKLPFLETLELDTFEFEARDSYLVDQFAVAPRLRNFVVGPLLLPTLAPVHFDKLCTFGCVGQDPSQVPAAMSLMSRLPLAIEFRLQVFLSHWTADNITEIDAPPTSSSIVGFSMETCDYFTAEHCLKALSDIFTNLTLPHLRDLKFRSQEAPFSLIYWPHSAFMDLAARSSFHIHLHSLSLCHVVVTEAEFVEALAMLPLLQRLEISDHQIRGDHGADQLLVTDSLFAALTLKPEPHTPRLVPLLQSILCQSLLQFDDHVYLNFLLSRRRPAPSDLAPFASRMYWQPGYRRGLDSGVVAQLRELCIRKELVCEFSRAELW
ncbi:hypothetical protein DFH09DRAFT_1375277 [Mycena vulgaris]|nr:hypothetical protein DFH09DRAFT_1375277 [Mycena vulgaris]